METTLAVDTLTSEDVIAFLRQTPPFQFLAAPALRSIAGSVSIEFYPKGTVILSQDGPPSSHLRIIKKGGVKVSVSTASAEEMIVDYRSEGDAFGILSMIGRDKSRANVAALDDTLCYLIPQDALRQLLDTNPAVTEYFFKSFLKKYVDKTYQGIAEQGLVQGGSERLLFTTPVGEIAARHAVSIHAGASIREAAALMSEKGISSLVVMDDSGSPLGILTDRDLRDKVVSRGRSVSASVGEIMSSTLIKVDARDHCFEALLRMIRLNIHHLLVVDKGKLLGIVTNHDLMLVQGTSPLSMAREIEAQTTVEGLVPVSRKVQRLIGLLLREGARACNITRVMTEINDRIVKKVLELTEKAMGNPPVGYCWISTGSEGRKEQTFRTDQDNAIVYDDPDDGHDKVRRYFAAFAAAVRDNLSRCGFVECPANYMASNPEWCQPLRIWKRYFLNWISQPDPEAVLKSLIFFDFRPLYGNADLARDLRAYITALVADRRVFLGQMANLIIKNRPPIGFFKAFVVEKGGEHRDELNLKVKGIAPLVDIVRLFSLEKGIAETSTIERIDTLRKRHAVVGELGDEMEHAFEALMMLRIHHQFRQIEGGLQPDNFINPSALNKLERRMLKDSFRLIEGLQDHIIERYRTSM